jgi:hypothetical protein
LKQVTDVVQRPPWIPAGRFEEIRAAALDDAIRERSVDARKRVRGLRLTGAISCVMGVAGVIATIWLGEGAMAFALSAALIAAGVITLRRRPLSPEELDRAMNDKLAAALDLYRREQLASTDFFHTEAWLALRRSILESKEARCVRCGRKASALLVVEHIRSRAESPELALDPANVEILCHACRNTKASLAASY